MTEPTAPVPVSVMVFTLNEALHLPSCLGSLGWCDDVIVIDSFSTDDTCAIATSAGARVFQHVFTGFGDQRNWALAHCAPRHDWVLILDADERVTPALADEMRTRLPLVPGDVGAFQVKRRFHMWGRWLRYSSLYPSWVVRLVHRGKVRYVNRGHAETQEVSGAIHALEHDLIDENLKGIDEWFARQNRYATQDAAHELALDARSLPWADLFSAEPLPRRAALKRIAARMPARPLLYFVYSYILRLGFRDGRDGLQFCLMKATYQRMVQSKKYDMRRRSAP
ncbi:MAG TPA: glycosyltransferase family 2 protein [Ramlibacter sp.]|nr:glycosyltransferase family 2 protein [Ramlibacter sp.]